MKLSEMGERRIIDSVWKEFGQRIDYDDCSYILRDNIYELFTTDFIGEGTHFLRHWNAERIGRFFAAINLSDIAAMGGVPKLFMASMALPGDVEHNFLMDFVRGMKEMLNRFGVRYLGGDMKESGLLSFSGFAIGEVEEDKILLRRRVEGGQKVFLTGELGKQAAGYILWRSGREEGIEYLLDVNPRIEEGRGVAGVGTAAMDLSDGIFSAIKFMGNEELGIRVDLDSLPISKLALEVSEDYGIPMEKILSFGGDYELIYTSHRGVVGKEVGEVVEKGLSGIWRGGRRVKGGEYAHFGKALDEIG